MLHLHFDIETYSSVDIRKSGVYRYVESPDFEILLLSYSLGDSPVRVVDFLMGDSLPSEFLKAFSNPEVLKCAHNATFERLCFKSAFGLKRPLNEWFCTQVFAAYCGLPLSLDMISKALNLGESGKKSSGTSLIRLFSTPTKPTKANGFRKRTYPHHEPEKWESYKEYNMYDVIAEKEIMNRLVNYHLPDFEKRNYMIDQIVNDTGVMVDLELAEKAKRLDDYNSKYVGDKMISLSGLDNPKSIKQLKGWLHEKTGNIVESLAKESISELMEETTDEEALEMLELRQKDSKSSAKKYESIINTVCEDGRVHGLLQFYGASRTGRWAGRLVQLQNLPRNSISDSEIILSRNTIKLEDFDLLYMQFDNMSDLLAQLIRSTFIAPEGMTFAVADYSAIEARVVAWLANESWRLEVFKTHGKIYEASASMMFGVPIRDISKGSELRKKGKVAELALGYGGGVNAMKKMNKGGGDMSEPEMKTIISRWRKTNPNIVNMWKSLEEDAIKSIRLKKPIVSQYRGLIFHYDGTALRVKLPSGRELFYWGAKIQINKFGEPGIVYKGSDEKKNWWYVDTYGGKLTENFVQAISRDILASSLQILSENGFKIVMHVHDEVICEVPEDSADSHLKQMAELMGKYIPWAPDLDLRADGYLTPFYKKD